jgi:hypothetical protein
MIANIGTVKSPHIQYLKISDKITATGLTFFTSRSGSLLGTALRVTGHPVSISVRGCSVSQLWYQ